jgi:hypothetical protein
VPEGDRLTQRQGYGVVLAHGELLRCCAGSSVWRRAESRVLDQGGGPHGLVYPAILHPDSSAREPVVRTCGRAADGGAPSWIPSRPARVLANHDPGTLMTVLLNGHYQLPVSTIHLRSFFLVWTPIREKGASPGRNR